MSQTLRWGVLSTARIADALVRAFSLSERNKLVAVASRDLAKARAWADKRSVPRAFGSYEEMLASDVIDAVYIPLPNSMHKEWTIRAAAQGKHILCEKPLANNAAEVREMIAAAQSNNVTLMEAFMYRFHPQYAQVQEMIAQGAIGELKIIRGTFGFALTRPEEIRWSKELAGGSLMDVGCYPVNASRLITGMEPVAVQASATWGETGVDASLAGVLEFPNGVIALIDSSFVIGGHQWVGISGTKGHIGIIEPFRMGEEPTTILYDHEDKHEMLHAQGANEYHRMVEHFYDVVVNHAPMRYPPSSSLAQMRVLDALYESVRTGKRVSV